MPEHRDPAQPRISAKRRLLNHAPRTRSVLAATGLLIICGVPLANAATGGALREGVRNGTTVRETEIISNVGSTLTPTGGYATRQSNLSGTGGGAVYGCRSGAGGSAATPRPQNPCIRANNLNTGYAFEFHASNGPIVGLISAGPGGDTKKPFITNATGVATGLNADRVDGKNAEDIANDAVATTRALHPFAQINTDGTAGETRGVATNGIGGAGGTGEQTITFNGDLSKCALQATVTGAAAGIVTVTPTVAADKATTAVTVRTFNAAGTATDFPYHVSASC
jgi:hypothetical protein